MIKSPVWLFALLGFVTTLARAEVVRLAELDLKLVDEFLFWHAGPPEAGKSAGDGAIVIAGRKFTDGIGVRGNTRWQLQLDGSARSLHGWTGMTDDSKEPGPVWFEVLGDGRMLYRGKLMAVGSPAAELSVPLAGVHTLVLVVQSPDHIQPYAAWADAAIDYTGVRPKAVSMPAEQPYILTPPVSPLPRINGARVFGVRAGHPVLFTIPVTGESPLTVAAAGLPEGLTFDPATRRLSGAIALPGTYPVTISVRNAQGQADETLRIMVGETLALTPPMGWNSWNCFAQDVSGKDIRAATDAMVSSGLREHGWSYINIDDFWATRPTPTDPVWSELKQQAAKGHGGAPSPPAADEPSLIGPARDEAGAISPNSRFPAMKEVVDYIHTRGFKAGIYSSPGPLTCGLCVASYGHESEDAGRWAAWGFDYLKYDWCTYGVYAANESLSELVKPYGVMGDALKRQPRDIVFSLCQYGMGDVWKWGAAVDGNLWRTTTDIVDSWASMSGNGFSQDGHEKFAGPGHWNDPDMLVVGKVGWSRAVHNSKLTPDEQYTHMSLWCLQAAPLLIGCDLTQLDDFTRGLLTNDEVIAIDQDPLGRPAGRVSRAGSLEVWSRPLEDGSLAVGLFNRGELPATVSASWKDLGLDGPQSVRDLWRQMEQGVFQSEFFATIPRHGVRLVKISRLSPGLTSLVESKALPARSVFIHPDTVPDDAWHAHWIGTDERSHPNQWTSFRREVSLTNLPPHAIARIAADTKYWLWVNGKLVVREGGLKRGPTPTDSYFDEIDLAPLLHPGRNILAVLVWHLGLDGFSHNDSGKNGLLFDLAEDDAGLAGILSGSQWRATPARAFGDTEGASPNFRLSESNIRFYAAQAMTGWTGEGFDDSGWPAAKDFGAAPCGPWNRLVRRPIPLWSDSGLKSYINAITFPQTSDGGVVVGRLPYNAQVTPYFKIEAPAGKRIEIRTDDYYGGSAASVRAEYITAQGVQDFECYGWMNGSAVHYQMPAGIKILALGYRESGYATAFAGAFACDDPFLNHLREKAARTLYLTMRDTYMDCPDRERSQWWGDVVNELGEVAYAFDRTADRLTRKGILELAAWQKPGGVLFAPIPAGNWEKDLPAQMLASIGEKGFWTYGLFSGDLDTLRHVYPAMKRYLEIWNLQPEGLVEARPGAWSWGDWGENIDMPVLINAWYYLALEGLKHTSTALEQRDDLIWLERRQAAIRVGFEHFWNGTEYRSPGNRNPADERANALAVVAGLAPPARYPALGKVLTESFNASPYMEKYVLEALCLMDRPVDAQARMKRRYAAMVDDSAHTTLWEGWGVGSEGYGGGTVNHAWSGGPLTIMSQYFAGITPREPGFKTYDIFPRPGALHQMKCTVATPLGEVRSEYNRVAGQLTMKIDSPPGTMATIGLPTDRGLDFSEVRVNGQPVANGSADAQAGGVVALGYRDTGARYLCYRVPPGAWTFVAK